jgi:uncharacterized protein YqeY
MSVIEKLKLESMRLRKERNPIAASITFALSEIEKVGKNAGNRATTEDEAIKVLQKLVATLNENLKVAADPGRKIAFNHEKRILESVLPQMASDEEITKTLMSTIGPHKPANKGIAMKVLRDVFGAKVDMKRAGEIVTGLYGV